MTNNIWHDSIGSNFTEIAGLVDNLKTIVKYNGKYAYLADLLALESKLEKAIQTLKLAKEKFEFIKYHIESGEDITVEPHCQIGIDEINKVLNKKGIIMKPKAYIFDIDGTIADCSHRLHFITGEHKDWGAFYDACRNDRPIPEMVMLLKMLAVFNCDILFITGRPERIREQTRRWLLNVADYSSEPYIKMRKDGDHRPDYIVKREIYEQEIKDKYDVIGVFEDRDSCVKMWRELGLTCFQVADGSY